MSDADRLAPRQLTHRSGPSCIAPRWSPNGWRLAFTSRDNSRLDVYVIPAAGGVASQLAGESSDESDPNWSGDGRFLYLRSARGGASQIWKVPAGGDPATRVTRGEESQALEAGARQDALLRAILGLAGPVERADKCGPVHQAVEDVREGLWALCHESVLFIGKPAGNPHLPERLMFHRFRDQSVSFVRDLPGAVRVKRVFTGPVQIETDHLGLSKARLK